MKAFWTEIWDRLKSPVVIFGLVATLLNAAQISPSNITSWGILGENIMLFLSNPFLIGTAIVAIVAYFNNPTDKEGW